MPFVFRPSTPADEPRLIAFLARVFSLDTTAAFINPSLLRWKFWSRREDYPDPRSYLLERDGQIAAHAGLWPMLIETAEGNFRGTQMIDWASDPAVPGAGIALVQRLVRQFDFMYSIGGSDPTQKILPAFGFKETAQTWIAGRPLRPLRQMLVHQERNWKLPLRLVRNTAWTLHPARPELAGWTFQEAKPADTPSFVPRPAGFFAYLQSCPVARIRVFRLLQGGEDSGWLALSLLFHEARVAGVWLKDPSPANLRRAYVLAQDAARRIPDACEISAGGSSSLSETAAREAGFRIMPGRERVWLMRKNLAPEMAVEFQLGEDDAFFRNGGAPRFHT